MAFYECVYLARPEITSAQVDSLTEMLTETLQKGGGEVKGSEYWGLRSLAYKVNKNRKAHYVLLNIDSPAEAVHEMERVMGLNEDIMRQLITRVAVLSDEPSVMMKKDRDSGSKRPYSPNKRFDKESS